MIKLTCQHCGKTFQVFKGREHTAKYCSRSCLASSKTGIRHPKWKGGSVTLACRNCGREYQVPYFERNRSHFCSKSCGNSFNQRGNKSHLWKGGIKSQKCPVCKNMFIPKRSGNINKFCSRNCYHIGNKILNTCPGCGKEFYIHPSTIERGRQYCSISCYRHHRIKPNTIEKAIQNGLTSRNITFISEYPVGRLHLDIYIPIANLDIECDGDYWHKNKIAVDIQRTKRLVNKGFTVIRFTETEIRKYPERCLDIIQSYIPP